MSAITDDLSFALDDVTSFEIDGDLYEWDNGWLGSIFLRSDDLAAPATVDIDLSGAGWNIGMLSFGGEGTVIIDISDIDADTGSARFIEYLRLGDTGTTDFPGSSTVSLVHTGVGTMLGGWGVDHIALAAQSYGQISLEGGDDTLILNGTTLDAYFAGNGADTLEATGSSFANLVDMGTGDDTVSLGDQTKIDVLKLGGGDNTVTIDSGFAGVGSILGYEGADTISIGDAEFVNSINVAQGANTIQVGAAYVGSITGLDDVDQVTLGSGGAGVVNVGKGANVIATGGGWVDSIVAYEDADRITIGSGGAGSVNAGHGANTVITDSGWVGAIVGLDGNDSVSLGSGGAGSVNVNGGNDSVTLKTLSNIADIVMVNGGNGTDTLSFSGFAASVSFSLASTGVQSTSGGRFSGVNFENLTGSPYGDTLTGSSVNNIIEGGNGADNMRGLAGNDTYYVNNSGDIINESLSGSSGSDRIISAISFSLANTARVLGSVEHLTLSGTTAITGTGNSLGNSMIGNSAANTLNGAAGNDRINGGDGNDKIYGGVGNDSLIGGDGNDRFVFNSTLSASSNVDRISDFNVADDTILLENSIFKALGNATGTLNSAMFWKSMSGTAHDSSDRIIYETDTGKLFYDSNGSTSGGGVHFATLSANLSLTYSDFLVV